MYPWSHTPPTPVIPVIPLPDEDSYELVHIHPSIAVRIHELLALGSDELVGYDFSLPPENTFRPDLIISLHVLTEDATNPPLRSLDVICPPLRRTFRIYPGGGNTFVRVVDVFRGIHHALRAQLGQDDYDRFPPHVREEIDGARYNRARRLSHPGARIQEYGIVTLVDLLYGIHVFAGLSNTPNGRGSLELHLSSAEGS